MTSDCPTISGFGWTLAFPPSTPGGATFTFASGASVAFLGVGLGAVRESMGLLGRMRTHRRQAAPLFRAESEVRLPFGAQPVVRREWSQPGARVMQVTTDVRVPHGHQAEEFSVDDIQFPAGWELSRVVACPEGASPYPSVLPAAAAGLGRPPLALIFQSQEGDSLEVGCGFDLWRWLRSDPAGFGFNLELAPDAGGLRLRRLVARFPADAPGALPAQLFRFHWHVAWIPSPAFPVGHKAKPKGMGRKKPVVRAVAWKSLVSEARDAAVSRVSWEAAEADAPLCPSARPVRNALRRLVRGFSGHPPRSALILDVGAPTVCDAPAHVERRGAAAPHWGYGHLLDFWGWANAECRARGARVAVRLSPESAMAGAPSALAMESEDPDGLRS